MKPRLYLIDAHAYLHRAYHALPPLTNSRGEPVGALFGFARTLLQVLRSEKPEGIAVCFDAPGPTFRHEAYDQYKATRKETEPELVVQLKGARELASAMGFACAELAGFEADDLMATLALKAREKGYEAVLVTGDKDALQLVGPGVRVLKDVTNKVWMDPPQVEEKLGIPPALVIDYLALVGDASDNVPGVPGIGPVGAVKLLKKFGGLTALVKAAKAGDPAVSPKNAKSLVEGEKTLWAAVELLRLRQDAPVGLEVADCRPPEPDPARLVPVLERLEFRALLKELVPGAASSAAAARPAAAAPSGGGTAVAERVEARAQAVEADFAKLKAGLGKAKAVTVAALRNGSRDLLSSSSAHLALGLESGETAVLDEKEAKANKPFLAGVLGGKAVKSAWNLKETEGALEVLGLELGGPVFDAMIAGYCLDPVRPKPIAAEGDARPQLLARASRALGRDELVARMKEAGVWKLYDEVELPVVEVLRAMEREGIALDVPYLRTLAREFEGEISSLKGELDALAGQSFNANSPKQLGELLFDKLGLPVLHKTAKGGRSTDEEALKFLAGLHAIPAKVLEYREATKLKSTYIDGLLERVDAATGRVHTTFDQTGAETGRLASLDPNLQNIPIRSAAGQRIRRAFIAPKGCLLVSADYSQIDLRVLAHASGDPVLTRSFEQGEDVHLRTACEVFGVTADKVDKELRRRAKAVNFGIVYGQTAFGLSAQLGIPQGEASAIIKAYFERYKGVAEWVERNLAEARRDGVARTFLGRVRRLPEIGAKNAGVRQFWERAARNTPIQGGSADIIKVAMRDVHKELPGRFKAKMLLQIHDELLFEVPEKETKAFGAWARAKMEGAVKLSVPLVVDVRSGRNWQDLEAHAS